MKDRLKFCRMCQHREHNFKQGMLCGLTHMKADFEDHCQNFLRDEKEATRQLKLDLAAEGEEVGFKNDFKKNKEIGGLVFLLSLLFTLVTIAHAGQLGFFVILYGGIFIGGAMYIKGIKQEQKLKEHAEWEDKHLKNDNKL